MSDVTFVGCGQQTQLGAGDGVRVTFVKAWPYLDVDFPGHMADVWNALPTTGARPLSPNNATATPPITTVDLQVHDVQTVAQLLEKLNGLDWWHISVSRFEKLSAQQRQQAATQGGSTARDAVDQDEQKKQDESGLTGWLNSLAAQFGTTVKVVLWILAVILVLVLLVYAGKLSNALKGA